MNKKKVFSYLFIGLLAVGATGTVTSCKDYDDDINTNKSAITELQKQLTTLQSALDQAKKDAETAHAQFATKGDITSLQEQISKLATADALQKAIDQLTELINTKVDKSTYDAKVKEIETAIDGIDSRLNTLGTSLNDLETAQKAANANIELQQKALDDLKAALAGKADQADVTKKISDLQDEIDALKGTSTSLDELKKQMKTLSDKVDAFSTQINVLTVFLKHSLASLTFIPDYFNEGVEAALVPAYEGIYQTTADNKAFEQKDNEMLSGYGVARYNVSPTTVDLLGSKVDFYSLASTVITRAGANYVAPVNAELTAAELKENYKDGVLTVPFKADWAKINALKADQLPIAALQISRGDTTVTSDYATVVAKKFSGMVVADNGAHNAVVEALPCGMNKDGVKHLIAGWENMTPANANITHKVAYNGHLNLDSLTEIHASVNETATNSAEFTLTPAELKALGLKVVYAPVDYTQGGNKTSETAHIQLSKNAAGETVAYPRNVTADGETIENETANKSSVGREPIVIVKVVDEATGKKVYAWGYIKIKITTPKQAISQITTAPMTFDEDIYDNCNDAELTTTWSQIEALVYSKLNLSKEEFEAAYKLDDNVQDAKQFEVKNSEYVALAATNKIGTVSEKQDANDPTTNVLSWKFTAAQLHALQSKAETGVTIYVHFKLKGSSEESEGVYVPLTIKPNQLHYATATVEGSKVLAQWYGLNSKKNAVSDADADEVRINVPVPTTEDNELVATEFTRNLHNYFLGNTLSYKLADETHFSSLKANATTNKLVFKFIAPSKKLGNATFDAAADGTWTVNGVSGTVYTLKVAENGNSLLIVKKGAAAVDETIASLATDGTISYVESADADDILNYKGHDELGERETFTAYIGLAIQGTCYNVPLQGKTWFNVRFVRPLDLTQPKAANVKDAPNEWQTIDVADLVKVNDWRDYVGDPTNSNKGKDQNNKFDFAYYGIVLSTDANAIYTDAANGANNREILTDVAAIKKLNKTTEIPGLELKGGVATAPSKLQYKNSSAVTGTFHLYVPVKMTYVFGQTPQTLYSVVTVKKTEGQQTAKKH